MQLNHGIGYFFMLNFLLHSQLSKKQKWGYLVYFIIAFISLHFARYSDVGSDYMNQTAGGRAQIIHERLIEINLSLINSEFGKYTNGAAKHIGGIITDSTYAALIANLGASWSIVFFTILGYYAHLQKTAFQDIKTRLILGVFSLASLGIIITEVTFPFLLLVFAKYFATQSIENQRG